MTANTRLCYGDDRDGATSLRFAAKLARVAQVCRSYAMSRAQGKVHRVTS
jgi:hypothetical protein